MNKRRINEREDWASEKEMRAKLIRNQEDRGRHEAYRGDNTDSGWDFKGKGTTDVHCFNCNKSGHYQKDCKNPPYCFCCKKDGHKSSVCPEKKGLRVCGFG